MDPELEEIRAKRLAELQAQQRGGHGGGDPQKEAEQRQREAEMRNNILTQVLDQAARARLNTLALTKPDKAKMVENMLLNMAQSGQLPGKMNDEQLKGILERINQQTKRTTTVKFDRRRSGLDSDSDENL